MNRVPYKTFNEVDALMLTLGWSLYAAPLSSTEPVGVVYQNTGGVTPRKTVANVMALAGYVVVRPHLTDEEANHLIQFYL